MEKSAMGVDTTKDDLSTKKMCLKKLLEEWINIDDIFITQDKKTLHKE